MESFPRPLVAALLLASVACRTAPTSPKSSSVPSYVLDPRLGFASGVAEEVGKGWTAFQEGDVGRARKRYEEAVARRSIAGEIGLIQVDVLDGRGAQAASRCGRLLGRSIETLPLLAACGEAYAQAGKPVRAFELYRRAVEIGGDRPFLAERRDVLAGEAARVLSEEARAALASSDDARAREKVGHALEIDRKSLVAHKTAAEVERHAGDGRAELDERLQAVRLAPEDLDFAEETGALAMRVADFPAAIAIYEELAARDPKYQDAAEEARVSFRISNWPAAEKQAADASRITRGQAARLLWWLFPAIRETVPASAPIATDALDRKDRAALVRAAGLGLLDVDPTTHMVRPDAPLTRAAASAMLLRLVDYLRGSRPRPTCMASAPSVPRFDSPFSVALAGRCGLIAKGEWTDAVSGKRLMRGLQRARELALEGAS